MMSGEKRFPIGREVSVSKSLSTFRCLFVPLCFMASLALAQSAGSLQAEEPIRIGRQKQLFLDNHLVHWTDKLQLKVNPVAKHADNPLIRPESDWEPNSYIMPGTVIYDAQDRIYKLWCIGYGPSAMDDLKSNISGCYYFTSSDGIHWSRPELDVAEAAGHKLNLVAPSDDGVSQHRLPHSSTLMVVGKDLKEVDPARRYKMAYLYMIRNYDGPNQCRFHRGQLRALAAAFSPDGIHWTPYGDNPVSYAIVDGGGFWFQHPDTGRFNYYGRTKYHDPEFLARYGADKQFQSYNWGRAVTRITSDDFVRWTPEFGDLAIAVDAVDGPGDEIYSMAVFPYEGIYLGLVQMFHNYPERVWLEIQLAVSRDGRHFQRLTDRSPFIPVGRVGEWDRFNTAIAGAPVRVGDDLIFYFSGRLAVHGGRYSGNDNGSGKGLRFRAGIGAGLVKLDRFAGLEATFDTGKVRTKSVVLDGGTLHLNANVRYGKLNIVVLDDKKRLPIEGLEAEVQEMDSTDIAMPLKGLEKLKETPVRLEISVTNGKLYSLWMSADGQVPK